MNRSSGRVGRRGYQASLSLLLVLIVGSFSACSASAAHSRNALPAKPVQSPTAKSRPTPSVISNTPGTEVVIQTSSLVLTNATHLDFSASGFAPGEALSASIVDARGTTQMTLPQAKADAAGNLPAVSLVMPTTLAPGVHDVVVEGQTSHSIGSAEFHIQRIPPTVQLDTYTGVPGAGFGVSGGGFVPGEVVVAYLGKEVGKPLADLTADKGGNVMGHLTVPPIPAGEYPLILDGRESASPVSVEFNVRRINPWVVLQNYAPAAGSAIIASGRDFAPDEHVMVYLGTVAGKPEAVLQADTQGGFSNVEVLTVSTNLTGSQELFFVGDRSGARMTVAFDIFPGTGDLSTPSPNVQP
jgi:hypothetical protein